jgi:UDP-N-acetylmuramoyl-tripeptide--D-alanyl-D-alanine ligase
MSFWTADNLRAVVGGLWLLRPGREASGLSTDTRTLKAGQVVLAIAGERFDGHAMLAQAHAAGAALAIVESEDRLPRPLPEGLGVLKVADTRRALLKLGAAYRRTLESTRVVAVVGSNGKTTTVRLIDSVLGASLRGSASVKSFNNSVGVPLTILAARPGDQYLVCEVGTNAPGEIGLLAEVVEPDVAVITSIGREHLEKLGSLRGVAREEAAVLEHTRAGGIGLVNADAPHLLEAIAGLEKRPRAVLSFGESPSADLRVVAIEQDFEGLSLALADRSRFRVPLVGRHNALNAAAAVAVGRRMGLTDEQISAGFARVKGAEMRLERLSIRGVNILNDAYNANPDSMRAGIETLGALGRDAARRVVIVGDMLELGEQSEASHREVGEVLAVQHALDLIVLVGPKMKAAAARLERAAEEGRLVRVDDMDEGRAAEVASLLRAGDLVLLKGSRGMRMERLIAAMGAQPARPAPAGT